MVDIAYFRKYFPAQLEAVTDSRGLREIQQRLLQIRILDVQVNSADQVGLIFFFCEPAGRSRRRAALG